MRKLDSIPWSEPSLLGNEQRYVAQAIASTWISGGEFVNRFENEFAQYCDTRFAVTASNGTTALHMAFLALSLGPGDEVIVPGFAFMAAANVALQMGATPVFAEVDPNSWCMTAENVTAKLSPRTKLIVPVHTYGNICPMDEVMALARDRSILVVEDAAEAFASRYKNRPAGSKGDLGSFSFHASKTITTGEGGMVITERTELRDRMYLFRNHGMLRTRYWHEVAGHNFRLTNMQAALGCAQLEKIDQIKFERQRVYDTYRKYLSGIAGISMQEFSADVEPVVWAMAVRLDPAAFPQGRDKVMSQFTECNIDTRNGFYAANMLRQLYDCPMLPICDDLSRNIISLPMYCALEDETIQFICSKLKSLRR